MNEQHNMSLTEWQPGRWSTAPLRIETVEQFQTEPLPLFISLTDPGEMCRTFGWMHKVTVDNAAATVPNGLGAIRRCHFGNGLVLEEEIVAWAAPSGFAYRGIDETHPFGMLGHLGIVQFVRKENGTELIWRQYFDHPNLEAMLTQLSANIEMVVDHLHMRFG